MKSPVFLPQGQAAKEHPGEARAGAGSGSGRHALPATAAERRAEPALSQAERRRPAAAMSSSGAHKQRKQSPHYPAIGRSH